MISFRQFLFESEFKRYGFKDGDYEFEQYANEEHIHGHHVETTFASHHKPGHYEVGFHVDGSYTADTPEAREAEGLDDMHPDTGNDILHHVHNTIRRFIAYKKPQVLHFHSTTKRKERVYSQFAKRLALRTGAQYTQGKLPGEKTLHILRFTNNND